jgi:hypothetical protein
MLDAAEAWGIFPLSSATGSGVSDLLNALWMKVRERMDMVDQEGGPDLEPSQRGMVSERKSSDPPPTEEEAWWEALDEEN